MGFRSHKRKTPPVGQGISLKVSSTSEYFPLNQSASPHFEIGERDFLSRIWPPNWRERGMCIHGGYKTQTVVQIGNLVGAYDAGDISLGAMRVYFAALVSVAAREAAKRSYAKVRRRGGVTPRFIIQELSRTTHLPLKRVTKELRTLKKATLLSFTESDITFHEYERETCSAGIVALTGGRSCRRPVPLPRTLLRFLAKSSKASLTKTALAYCVRGLTLSRSGEISGKGSIKATTIATTLNMSERSVRSARATLLSLGFITDDEASFQRKLNRTGAYFTMNLSWVSPEASKGVIKRVGLSGGATKGPKAKDSLSSACNAYAPQSGVDNSRVLNAGFAPPGAKNRTLFAPPYKDKKTYFVIKNQETQRRTLNPSGLCTAKTQKPKPRVQSALPPPNIRDVRAEDLKSFGRVEELYRQAVKVKLIEPTEANAINFIGAAARATRVEGDAPRIFMGIIRGKLWKNITQGDEDRALGALRRYRGENPDRFRLVA